MTFEVPKLKYPYDALEPHLSHENVRYHYAKHTVKYFDTMNELIKGTTYAKHDTLEQLVKDGKLRKETKLYNNVHQAYNHQLYWENLAPVGETGEPSKELLKVFGDMDEYKKRFEEAATAGFGSYWCWAELGESKVNIHTTNNADTPTETILFVVDGWEHAWYPTYFNDKAKYFKNIWNIINWNAVNERYNRARTKNEA